MRASSGVAAVLLSCWILYSSLCGVVSIEARPSVGLREWTLAVYMDSDNNLDYYAQLDLEEMTVVGSTTDVAVVVFWDSLVGPAYSYRVLRGGVEVLEDYSLCGVEVDMGDSETLRSWVSYTSSRFPSRKYALLCWDHGDDFRGCMFDEHVPEPGFRPAYASGDCLGARGIPY